MARWLKRGAAVLALLLLAAMATAWWLLRGSLPTLDGELALAGLSAPVSVQRDALGVVTVEAANPIDAARALGYVHAQERFFEMDLLRRSAAGELSELVGERALELDKRRRQHRLRARIDAHLDAFAGDKLGQLQAYSDGVNAGLQALRVRPWPYLLLRQSPRPWTPADSALTGYAMYFDLQDSRDEREYALWQIRQHVPPALYALLSLDGTPWDAPLFGATRPDAVLPDAQTLDLRKLPMPAQPRPFASQEEPASGSNNFAVAGAATADGRAIVADDMHLGLRAPNIWFRARLRYADPRAPGGRVDVQGFSLPGLPAIVVGSNGHIAWGFTNSYADTTDWRLAKPCAAGARMPGCDAVTTYREIVKVAGQAPVTLEVKETGWGPILHERPDGGALALRWTAHMPGALNFGVADFAVAKDLDNALEIAAHTAIPTQNLLVADASGRIAWRLLGPLPQRSPGCSSQHLVEAAPPPAATAAAVPAADAPPAPACAPWPIATADNPHLIDPANARLWTANARTLDGEALLRVGDGGYDLGARAQQIRDGLLARPKLGERDLLAIQLDDRAVFLERWWRRLREDAERVRTPALQALAEAAGTWDGHASAESVSYRIVRSWRLAVVARIADGLTAPAQAALGDDFVMPKRAQLEGVVWPLVTQRPPHLLPRRYACASLAMPRASACEDAKGWDALLEDAAAEVRDGLSAQGALAGRNWGEANTARICHPLAGAIPLLGRRLLCMPADPLRGDHNMPRVVLPDFGASERMVVSPGHEDEGIIHMPGGQSGNPLSPFWGAGHEDWVEGRPTPFLPGAPAHALRMTPAPPAR
ncbi:penicillin acylase family protein [Luteimonas aquatica]|uniref:penicillin acylase family protein n=1 Tax=Luteimonas aquatica TaxID=450364 RepID=UPI001F582817|nr:penicillin acylase family protein [Luteimonas aquatica]